MAQDGKTAPAGMPRMPLAFVESGRQATVAGVRGAKETRRHLETLGFTEGSCVRMVSSVGGDVIVEVRGTQIALDRRIAMDVMAAG